MVYYSVHPLLSAVGGEGGAWQDQMFKKGGPWPDLRFWRGVAGKEGVTFFRGGCNFLTKNNLKSGMFNDKKS